MAIDFDKVLSDMISAAANAAKSEWPKLESFAETEIKKLAETAAHIEVAKLTHQITELEAATLLEMQKNASRAVLLGIQGIGLLVAEATINAALGVLKQVLNAALGFALV